MMLKLIEKFQKDAQRLGRDRNSIEEFKIWLEAEEKGGSVWEGAKKNITDYTIELDNDLGRGHVMLQNGHIVVRLPDGSIEDTEIRSTPEKFDADVYATWGGSVWNLKEGAKKNITDY